MLGRLWIRFNNGIEGVYDAEPERRGGVFESLIEPAAFDAVSINDDFGCVEWPGGADRCPTSMHEELASAEDRQQTMTVKETPPAKE